MHNEIETIDGFSIQDDEIIEDEIQSNDGLVSIINPQNQITKTTD